MGFGPTDLNRVRGALREFDLFHEHPAVRALIKWLEECTAPQASIVIDFCGFARTVREIAELRGIHHQTVTRRFYAGLCCYCKMMGWPSLTAAQFEKLERG